MYTTESQFIIVQRVYHAAKQLCSPLRCVPCFISSVLLFHFLSLSSFFRLFWVCLALVALPGSRLQPYSRSFVLSSWCRRWTSALMFCILFILNIHLRRPLWKTLILFSSFLFALPEHVLHSLPVVSSTDAVSPPRSLPITRIPSHFNQSVADVLCASTFFWNGSFQIYNSINVLHSLPVSSTDLGFVNLFAAVKICPH